MTLISDKSNWKLDNQEARMGKGPLLTVRHPDGHYTKMYEADAIATGLVPGKKAQPQAENKMAPAPVENKSQPPAEPDDFTTIEGVGPAAARSIIANGVTTFAQLKAAKDLSFLSKKARTGIEAWIGG
jgi:predicted flap endonuclease-1-like 5' DNA nuclease